MAKQINDEFIDKEIAKTDEEIQNEKKEKLIQLIIDVVVGITMKEFYETRDRAMGISSVQQFNREK